MVASLLLGAGSAAHAASAKTGGSSPDAVPAPGRPAADLIGYWQRFGAAHPGPLAVAWSRDTGAAESILGTLSAPGASSEAAASRFFADNAALFRMGAEQSDLQLAANRATPLGRNIGFQQVYRGVPVFGAEAALQFNAQGRVIAVNSSYRPGIFISTTPSIDRAAALRNALLAVNASDTADAAAELVVYPLSGSYLLAWRVTTATDDNTWEVLVDAQAGTLIGKPRDINRYASGQVFRVNAVVATQNNALRDGNDAASAVPLSAYSTVTLQGLSSTSLLDGVYASSSKTKKRATASGGNFKFTRDKDGFSETMGYYYIDFAERYIQTLGFSNVNNRQQVFSANGTTQDNSFYSPSTKQITYGTGGVDDAEDAEVILHEYGHSIQDNQKPGFGSSAESGAMGEGFGDYWAASVGAQQSGGFQDVCVMEWDASSYSSTNPPCLRRLDSIKRYPQSVVNEVHADGEIWAAALWQIWLSVGAAKADKLVLQHHFLIPANASFNTAANALVTAATNLGFTSTEIAAIRSILQNRGFTVTV